MTVSLVMVLNVLIGTLCRETHYYHMASLPKGASTLTPETSKQRTCNMGCNSNQCTKDFSSSQSQSQCFFFFEQMQFTSLLFRIWMYLIMCWFWDKNTNISSLHSVARYELIRSSTADITEQAGGWQEVLCLSWTLLFLVLLQKV